MNSKDAEINRLVLENGKLRAEAARAFKPCRTCKRVMRHDCGAFFACPFLGIVNPDEDGCTKHKGGTDGKKLYR